MTSDSEVLYQSCADALSALVEQPFEAVASLGSSFAGIVNGTESHEIAAGDLSGVDAEIDGVLAAVPGLLGAGVVVRPGFLQDANRFLEWRQRQGDGSVAPLILELSDDADDPYDYPNMEWFRVPADEGRRMVGGPYFDYRGNERCTLTFAVPVVVDGQFLGVVGADQTVTDLESSVLPVLRKIPVPAALLNHERRVVTANTPELVTGQRVPATQIEACVSLPVGTDLGWSLVILEGA